MRKFEKLAVVWGVLLLAACGGDSDTDDAEAPGGSAGDVDTGLPEATPLEDVTPEQYADACESLREDVAARLGPDRAVRGVCEVYGAAVTDVPADCRSAADSCVPQINSGGFALLPNVTRDTLDFTQFECGDTGELAGCSVTVGEFETCLEDQMTSLETLMADNDCDNAANVGLAEAMALANLGSTSPPSCARLQQECPGVGPFADLASP